jgi:hypothetical protein
MGKKIVPIVGYCLRIVALGNIIFLFFLPPSCTEGISVSAQECTIIRQVLRQRYCRCDFYSTCKRSAANNNKNIKIQQFSLLVGRIRPAFPLSAGGNAPPIILFAYYITFILLAIRCSERFAYSAKNCLLVGQY